MKLGYFKHTTKRVHSGAIVHTKLLLCSKPVILPFSEFTAALGKNQINNKDWLWEPQCNAVTEWYNNSSSSIEWPICSDVAGRVQDDRKYLVLVEIPPDHGILKTTVKLMYNSFEYYDELIPLHMDEDTREMLKLIVAMEDIV